jgi:hypothetical protein
MRPTKLIGIVGVIGILSGCASLPIPPGRALHLEVFDYRPDYELLFETQEMVLIEFRNGNCLVVSTYQRDSISVSIKFLDIVLETLDKTWKDVKVITHNHFFYPTFSERDLKTFIRLRMRGFMGEYRLYCVFEKRITQRLN